MTEPSVTSKQPINEQLEIHSPLPVDVCVKRLAEAIDCERWPFSYSSFFGKRPVVGTANNSSLRLRKRIAYGNSFQTILTVTLQPERSGTFIQGTFGMSTFTKAFRVLWRGAVIFLGGIGFIISLAIVFAGSPSERGNPWPFLIMLPGFLLFDFVLIRFGRYLARDEAGFLADFVRQTLDADGETHNA